MSASALAAAIDPFAPPSSTAVRSATEAEWEGATEEPREAALAALAASRFFFESETLRAAGRRGQ
jgi:hypothetical protein